MAHFLLLTGVGEGMEGSSGNSAQSSTPGKPFGDFEGVGEEGIGLFFLPLSGSDLHPEFLGGSWAQTPHRWNGNQRASGRKPAWPVPSMTLWEGLPQAATAAELCHSHGRMCGTHTRACMPGAMEPRPHSLRLSFLCARWCHDHRSSMPRAQVPEQPCLQHGEATTLIKRAKPWTRVIDKIEALFFFGMCVHVCVCV